MRIEKAMVAHQAQLLTLMRESFNKEIEATAEEWTRTADAVKELLRDSRAGEAYLIFDDDGDPVGYIIMCRGFSLDYGGYFTWVEESYMRQEEQGRFRDQRFSP